MIDCWLSKLLVGRPCALCPCRISKVIPGSASNAMDAWGDVGAGAGADAAAKASKRTLKRDSHDTLMLLTPFMLWSTLVFIFYAVSVQKLEVRLGRRGVLTQPITAPLLLYDEETCAACRGRHLSTPSHLSAIDGLSVLLPPPSCPCPRLCLQRSPQNVDPLVALASVSNYNIARTYRTCFYAQVGQGHVGRGV